MNLCGWGNTETSKVGFPKVQITNPNRALYSTYYHGQNQSVTTPDQYFSNPTKVSVSSYQSVGEKLGQTSITNTSSYEHSHPGHISQSQINSSKLFPSKQKQQNINKYESYPNSVIPEFNSSNKSRSVPQQSYSALVEENLELKRIIENEYKPLKQLYSKLKTEHDDREYLVSQLEWKVKQLANDMNNKRK